MKKRVFAIVAGVLFLLPAGIGAQVTWDAPFHMGPALTDGLGLHVVDFEMGADDGVGGMVSWRRASIPGGVGLRMGLAEGIDGDLAGFGGVDVSGLMVSATDEFPLDVIWAAGAGAGIGDYALISFPMGLFIGRSFEGEGVRFVPYFGPKLALDAHLGRDAPAPADEDELELSFSMELGTDLVFGDDLAIRFGASLVEREALSIGAVFPTMR